MVASSKGLKEYAKNKTKMTLEKVDKAIQELFISNQKINFNSVSNLSDVSKTFLYNNAEIKKKIDGLRCKQSETVINPKSKYNKTNKSKDIVMAKEKKIKELKEENIKLKEQLEILRGKLYEII